MSWVLDMQQDAKCHLWPRSVFITTIKHLQTTVYLPGYKFKNLYQNETKTTSASFYSTERRWLSGLLRAFPRKSFHVYYRHAKHLGSYNIEWIHLVHTVFGARVALMVQQHRISVVHENLGKIQFHSYPRI